MIKKADWLGIAKDRTAVLLLLGFGVLCVILIATTLLRVQQSDIQIPVRYSGYGVNFIFRDQWYTQFSYAGFALIVGAINGFLALRVYQLRRLIGLGLLGMSIFVMAVAILVANAIFNLAPTA